jgi:hypothetical protein
MDMWRNKGFFYWEIGMQMLRCRRAEAMCCGRTTFCPFSHVILQNHYKCVIMYEMSCPINRKRHYVRLIRTFLDE